MAVIKKSGFDDWELRAKRVQFLENPNKNKPTYYKQKNKNQYNTHIGSPKGFEKNLKKFVKKTTNVKQKIPNTEVVVKITSCSKNFKGVAKHLGYITRDGNLEALCTDLDYGSMDLQYEMQGKDSLEFIRSFYKDDSVDISNKPKREYRETYNIVFSTKDYNGTETQFSFDPQSVKTATYKTIKKLFPNNHFTLVLHTDTNNPHCHLCLKVKDKEGKRLDIRKKDIFNLRKTFAEELTKLGINSTATFRKDRPKRAEPNLSCYEYTPEAFEQFVVDKNPRVLAQRNKCFEIVDYGEANYEFKDNATKNYFITYLTRDYRPVTIWGEDLKRVVEENNLKKGDFARFGKVGFDYKMSKTTLHKNNALFEVTQPIKYSKWDCIVYDKETKSVNKKAFVKTDNSREMPKSTFRLIKKLNKEEYNERPNNFKQPPAHRKYTREQWARYNARKRVSTKSLPKEPPLHLTHTLNDRPKESPTAFNCVRTLSQISMDTHPTPPKNRDREQPRDNRTQLFLPDNPQLNLPKQESSNHTPMRRTDTSSSRDRETKRGELEW